MKPIAGLLSSAALTLLAGVAHAQSTYPQVYGPGNTHVAPQAVTQTGVLADGVTPCVQGQTVYGSTCLPPAAASPGTTPVTVSFTATGQSTTFYPAANRGINVSVQGNFVGTVEVDRYINGAWQPLTVSAGGSIIQMNVYSAPASEIILEPQAAVAYRLNCTAFTSGTIVASLTQ